MTGEGFYLGTHLTGWLGSVDVPLFVSRRRLAKRRSLPKAIGPWALDSGGFTELQMFGRWTVGAPAYAAEVRRFRDEIGGMRWAAPQDWMCEPVVIEGGEINGVKFAGTGLSVAEHQRRTVANYLELKTITPDLPWIPVLQGWEHDDYLRHIEDYREAGIELKSLPLVGLGTVCRRQDTAMAEGLVRDLHSRSLRIHGFGFKKGGLTNVAPWMTSADSLAWSYHARRNPQKRLPGCMHKSCANCLPFALQWRDELICKIERMARRPRQETLFH